MSASFFPVTICGYDHPSWRNWAQAIPEARFRDADVKDSPWMHAEDLAPCKRVAVGVLDIPSEIIRLWMMTDKLPTPREVLDAIHQGKKS